MLPFTLDQFLDVFARYNLAVWPAQAVAYLLGLAIVIGLWRRRPGAERILLWGLAALWLWTGVVYHGLFFSAINKAAFGFALLFVVQAALFAWAARSAGGWGLARRRDGRIWLGAALIAYASIVYPLIGVAVHDYPAVPMFGITPCPLTLFTFGLLLTVAGPVPRHLLVIPFLWALIGGSAAFLLQVPQDWPLLISGLVVVPLLWGRGAGPIRQASA